MSLKASCIFHVKKNWPVNLKIFSNTFSWLILPIKMEKLQIFEEIDGLTLSSFLTSCFYSLKRLFLFVPFPYLRARTIETSSLPTNSSWPLFKQIEIFFLIYWLYISTISTFLHIRASLMLETASCTRINDIISKTLIKKNSKILYIWTWCSLRWYNYFFAALQIIFSLACVSIETHKLSPSPVLGASGPLTKKNSQNFAFTVCVTPNLANKFCPIMWLVPVPGRLLA